MLLPVVTRAGKFKSMHALLLWPDLLCHADDAVIMLDVRKLTEETVAERKQRQEEPYLRRSRAVPTTHTPPTVVNTCMNI